MSSFIHPSSSSSSTSGIIRPPKYVQADTWRLDMLLSTALTDMVQNTLESLLGPVKALAILPEIQLTIDTLTYLVPAFLSLPTPGQRVFGLQYGNGTINAEPSGGRIRYSTIGTYRISRRRTFGIGTMLFATYCYKKLKMYSRSTGWDELPLTDTRYHVTIILHCIQCIVALTKVGMALRFIIYGDYVTFTDRISNLRLEYTSNRDSNTLTVTDREMNFRRPQLFDTLALQILSNAASELVQSVSTLTDWTYTYQHTVRFLRRNYRRLVHRISSLFVASSTVVTDTDNNHISTVSPRSVATESTGNNGWNSHQRNGIVASPSSLNGENSITVPVASSSSSSCFVPSIPKIPCVYCSTLQAIMPIRAFPCQHTYCYFCLHSLLLQDPSYECPSCGEYIRSSKLLR